MASIGSSGAHRRTHGASPARHPAFRDGGVHASRNPVITSGVNENRNTLNTPTTSGAGAYLQHGRRQPSSPGPAPLVGPSSTGPRLQHGPSHSLSVKGRSPIKERTVGVRPTPYQPQAIMGVSSGGCQTSGRKMPSYLVSLQSANLDFSMLRTLHDKKVEVHVSQPGGTCDEVMRPPPANDKAPLMAPPSGDLNSSGLGASQTLTSISDVTSSASSPERETQAAGRRLTDLDQHFLQFSAENAVEEDSELVQIADMAIKRPRRDSFSDMPVDDPEPTVVVRGPGCAATMAQQLPVDDLSLVEVESLMQRLQVRKRQLLGHPGGDGMDVDTVKPAGEGSGPAGGRPEDLARTLFFIASQYPGLLNPSAGAEPRYARGDAFARQVEASSRSVSSRAGPAGGAAPPAGHVAGPVVSATPECSRERQLGGGARAPDHKMFMSRVALDGSADLSGFPEEMSPLESVDASAFESTKPSGVESADEDGSLALESSCSSPVSLPDCGADSWMARSSASKPPSPPRGVIKAAASKPLTAPRRLKALKSPGIHTDITSPDLSKSIASLHSPRSAFSPRTPRSSVSSL